MAKAQKSKKPALERLVCDLVEAPRGPGEVLLVPWGQVDSKSGMFIVNEESCRAAEEAFAAHGNDIVIDYEHASLQRAAMGTGLTPAAGWIRQLRGVPNEGIYAEVEWTADAARMINNKQYRYMSPVVLMRPSDNIVVQIESAALTHRPAIPHMAPIVNSEAAEKADAETDSDAPLGGMNELNLLLTHLRRQLGLTDNAPPKFILAAIKAASGSLSVANASTEALQAELDQAKLENVQLRNQIVETEIVALLNSREHEAKVMPCDLEWFQGFYRREPELAKEWLQRAPKQVATRFGEGDVPFRGPARGRDRKAVIARARAQYNDGKGFALQIASERAYVSEALVAAGFARLSIEDAKAEGIPVE